jgi:hypothetical protein
MLQIKRYNNPPSKVSSDLTFLFFDDRQLSMSWNSWWVGVARLSLCQPLIVYLVEKKSTYQDQRALKIALQHVKSTG